VAREARIDPAGARAPLYRLAGGRTPNRRPRSDEHPQGFRLVPRADPGYRSRHPLGAQARHHLLASLAAHFGTFDAHRQALAFASVQKRLQKRAHYRGHVLGLAPIVQVPPDVIARVYLRARPALGRLDAVYVIEPVDRVPILRPAGEAVDALHEAASVAGGDRVVAHQQAQNRLLAASLRRPLPTNGLGAEVFGDRQMNRARRGPRSKAASGKHEDKYAEQAPPAQQTKQAVGGRTRLAPSPVHRPGEPAT